MKYFRYFMFWIMLSILAISCVNDPSAEKQSADDDGKTTSKTSLSSVINDPNVKDGDTIDLSKPEYKDITDFTATINKSLIIKNGYSLKDAAITVTADGVVLDNIHGVSVTTDKSISISDSELSGLTISSSSQNGSGNNADTAPVIVIVNSSAANITLDIANTIVSLSGSASAEQVTVSSSVTLNVSGANVNVSNITASVAVTVLLENNASIDIENENISKVTVTNPVLTGLKLKCFDSEIYDDQIPFGGLIVIGEYTQDDQTFSKPITDYTLKVDNAVWTAGTKLSAGTHSVIISSGDKTAVKALIVKKYSDSSDGKEDPKSVSSGLTQNVSLQTMFYTVWDFPIVPSNGAPLYDVTLDAENATFIAAKSLQQINSQVSSPAEFEGNFFVCNKNLLWEITEISGETLSDKIYCIIPVPEEIYNGGKLLYAPYVCQISADAYEEEKSAFERALSGTVKTAKNVTAESLNGSRWISDHCLGRQEVPQLLENYSLYLYGSAAEGYGCTVSFSDETVDITAGVGSWYVRTSSKAVINGSTVTAEFKYNQGSNDCYDATATVTFYQDDTAELFIEMIKDNSGNENGGINVVTFRSVLMQATGDDLLVNTIWPLKKADNWNVYIIEFHSGVFTLVDPRRGFSSSLIGQGSYTLSGESVSLTFSDDKSLSERFRVTLNYGLGTTRSTDTIPLYEEFESYQIEHDDESADNSEFVSGTITATFDDRMSPKTVSGTVLTDKGESVKLVKPEWFTGTYITTSITLDDVDVTSDLGYTLSFDERKTTEISGLSITLVGSLEILSKDNKSSYGCDYYGTGGKFAMRGMTGVRAKSSEYYLLKDIAVTYTDGSSFTLTANAYANNELIGVQKMIFCRED